jgi:predicted lipoprotein with Yx(FWY)xxD motif
MGHRRIAAGALPLILILAACSSSSGATAAPSVAAPSTPAASPSAVAGSPDAGASGATGETVDLKVAAGTGSATNYLTGADGKTLYIFTNDAAGSGKSSCSADCAASWPPLTVASLDEVKPDAAVTGALALVTRDDGTSQVSYKGQPLYYFAGDKAAGDTNGQGLNGKWFVANP